MTKVNVDNHISEMEFAPNGKVSELVDSVLRGLPSNRIITEITLDGKSWGRTSDASSVEAALSNVKELQIKTADREIWRATGLDIALSCVESVQRTLLRAAELFRMPDKAKANSFFVHCTDGLERFLEAVTITRCAQALDFSRIDTEAGKLSQVEEELETILANVLKAQEMGDAEKIADRLEYELIPHLHTWNAALRKLRSLMESNA